MRKLRLRLTKTPRFGNAARRDMVSVALSFDHNLNGGLRACRAGVGGDGGSPVPSTAEGGGS